MKVMINDECKLVIISENNAERFALEHWNKKHRSKGIILDFSGMDLDSRFKELVKELQRESGRFSRFLLGGKINTQLWESL